MEQAAPSRVDFRDRPALLTIRGARSRLFCVFVPAPDARAPQGVALWKVLLGTGVVGSAALAIAWSYSRTRADPVATWSDGASSSRPVPVAAVPRELSSVGEPAPQDDTPWSDDDLLAPQQIQSTASRYAGSVRRRCWQPALDARDQDAPLNARVMVTVTISSSGVVESATSSGDAAGYPGLAKCVTNSVKDWAFPAAVGRTIANVPFIFAAQ